MDILSLYLLLNSFTGFICNVCFVIRWVVVTNKTVVQFRHMYYSLNLVFLSVFYYKLLHGILCIDVFITYFIYYFWLTTLPEVKFEGISGLISILQPWTNNRIRLPAIISHAKTYVHISTQHLIKTTKNPYNIMCEFKI